MNADTLGQIADVLERIESHLAVIARLLAAQQGVTTTVLSDGRVIGHYDSASDTRVAPR